MEVKYCPRCHREAYRMRESDGKVEIIQGGKNLVTTDKTSTISMNVNCPMGHPVKVKVGSDE